VPLINAAIYPFGNELSSLAAKLVSTSDAAEAAMIRGTIIRGFYGERRNA